MVTREFVAVLTVATTVTAPLEQPQRYVDRHHSYSILLQAVCDERLVFRDIYVGQPGSVGDKRTFSRSLLGKLIFCDPDVVSGHHLLGDGGYTCSSKFLIPYRDNGNLTRRQRVHKRSFGVLKGRWRRLKMFHNYNMEYLIDSIVACIVVHNFIILEGNTAEGTELNEIVGEDIDLRQIIQEAKEEGILKRDFIANQLFH